MTEILDLPVFLPSEHTASIGSLEAGIRQRRRQSARRDRMTAVVYPIGMMVVLIAIWEAAVRLFSLPPYRLPAPSAIVLSMYENSAVLIKESAVTTLEIILGFALSVAVGVPLALAIYLWRPFARAVYPVAGLPQAVPKVAVAPLFLVWFGFGLLPKGPIAFLIAFFPVVIISAMGLAALEREKIYLARSMVAWTLCDFLQDPVAERAAFDFRWIENLHHLRRRRRRGRRIRRRPGRSRLPATTRQR